MGDMIWTAAIILVIGWCIYNAAMTILVHSYFNRSAVDIGLEIWLGPLIVAIIILPLFLYRGAFQALTHSAAGIALLIFLAGYFIFVLRNSLQISHLRQDG